MALVQWLRGTLVVAAVGFGVGLLPVNLDTIRNVYLDVYPSDPAKRQALELCFLQDQAFNRLDAGQRDTCYRHALVATQAQNGATRPYRVDANAIDLQRAAAAGSMPRNDIRLLEQNENVRPARP